MSNTTAPQMLEVPFFPQQEYQCGPAALATVLVASGVETSPELLTPQIYLPERQGSLQLELLAATRRAGRVPYVIQNDLASVFAQVEHGRPVLLLQNLRTQHFPVWHYAVLTGFDTVSEEVYLNTGISQKQVMSVAKFARLWDWAGNWALVVLEPGDIPPLANPKSYFEAVAQFEAVADFGLAEPAWRSAIQHWPEQSQPFLALGNQAYAQGDLTQAASLYREGLKINVHNPGLTNNLASVLGEMGCPRAGEKILQPLAAELATDSAWRDIVATTLAELALLSQDRATNCG